MQALQADNDRLQNIIDQGNYVGEFVFLTSISW